MSTDKNSNDHLIIGVGSSAGGIEALKLFAEALPDNPGYAIVIVQHLAPDHESLMPELLSRVSPIPVTAAKSNEKVEVNHIYVIPPNSQIELNDNKLILFERDETRGSRETIDRFFRSLAEEKGKLGVGIVLSGAGHDGTAGLRAIKASGGLILAQDPDTAKYSSMPLSAIRSNIIDKVLPVADIPALLASYAQHPYAKEPDEEEKVENTDSSLHEITAVLRHHEGFDLRQYKPGTILRRITRRMGLLGMSDYKEYLEYIRSKNEERKNLTKDLLINVTDFFRDTSAFEALENKVIDPLVGSLNPDEEVRVWVAGCASGEEAYSIAILLKEALNKKNLLNKVNIFATDIDDDCIAIARKGLYPSSIVQGVPSNFLKKYFIKQDEGQYLVKEEIRDCISFARQNLTSDPPFSRLHLVSCRNLLIYLKREIQEEIFRNFNFSLLPEGSLFLGTSESTSSADDLFNPISKKWRLYKKSPGAEKSKRIYSDLGFNSNNRHEEFSPRKHKKAPESKTEAAYHALANAYLPAAIVVGGDDKILFQHGKLKDYIDIPEGEPSNDFYSCLPIALSSKIRGGIYMARKSKNPQFFISSVPDADPKEEIHVTINLLDGHSNFDENSVSVLFKTVKAGKAKLYRTNTTSSSNSESETLAQELAETKEELQNTIEELEASSEELKASHEESLSINEELQSANEELESSSEELRSLNEELSTTNEQLKDKIADLRQTKDDTSNFFESTNVATIFVNENLDVQRFTPAAEEILKLGAQDQGRNISTLPSPLIDERVIGAAKRVFNKFQPETIEKALSGQRWFNCHVTPYRTADHRVSGVVIVFQDVTELRKLSYRAQVRESQQAVIARLGQKALTEVDINDLMEQAVRQIAHVLDVEYCKILRFQPEHKNFLMVAGTGWASGLVGSATVPDDIDSQAGYTLKQVDTVIVEDLQHEKRFVAPSILSEHHVVSGMSCIINHSDPPYGVLGIHSKKARKFSRDDANFLKSVSNLISTALRTKDALEKLTSSEERFQIAKESAKLGVFEWDVKNDVVIWDKTLQEMWNTENSEKITYQSFLDRVHPDDIEEAQKDVRSVIDLKGTGGYFSKYRILNRKTGELAWIEVKGKMFFENGAPIRLVGMVMDVTEHKKLTERLESLVKNLEDTDKKKNNFLSILGHELR